MRWLPLKLKGWNRPESVIHVGRRERPLPDRKADIAYEEIIVRRGNRFDCPLFPLLADVGWVAPLSRLVANNSGLSDKTNEQWLWSSAAAILALRSRCCEPSTASKTEMPANRFLRPLSGVKLKKRKPIFGL